MAARFEQVAQEKAHWNLWVELTDDNGEQPELFDVLDAISLADINIAVRTLQSIVSPERSLGPTLAATRKEVFLNAINSLTWLYVAQTNRQLQKRDENLPQPDGRGPQPVVIDEPNDDTVMTLAERPVRVASPSGFGRLMEQRGVRVGIELTE